MYLPGYELEQILFCCMLIFLFLISENLKMFSQNKWLNYARTILKIYCKLTYVSFNGLILLLKTLYTYNRLFAPFEKF